MSTLVYLLAGLFLPLFPLSMLFNLLYARVRNPAMRGLLLLVWPQVGLTIIFAFGLTHSEPGSNWILAWALSRGMTSALALNFLFFKVSIFAVTSCQKTNKNYFQNFENSKIRVTELLRSRCCGF